jgi:glycerophosphoryl diester phosphodiesterase
MQKNAWPYPFWIAHRGAGRSAPENTMAAFRKGYKEGFRMFECDAKLSADGQIFLLHDAELERTTNATGLAGLRTWPALQKLDAGSWFSDEFSQEPVPLLAQVAEFCILHRLCLNIEIKATPGSERITGQRVAQAAARLWKHSDIPPLLTSFDLSSLEAARSVCTGLPLGILSSHWNRALYESLLDLGCVALVLQHQLWNAHRINQIHSLGIRALAYTVNRLDVAKKLRNLQIDGIITDRVAQWNPAIIWNF